MLWQSSAAAWARPVVDGRAVYTLGEHTVQAFDKTTGASLWSMSLVYPNGKPERQGYGTAMAAGHLIIGDIDVFGLDPATGEILWRFAPRLAFPNERAFQRLTTDGVTVYCGGVWGNVYAVDATTGVEKWVTHVTTLPDSTIRVVNPIVDRGVVYVAFDDTPPGTIEINAGLAAIDATSGRLLWSIFLPRHFGGTDTETESLTLTSERVVAGAWDGYLYGVDRQTGEIKDSISQTVFDFPNGTTQATPFALATADGVVFAGVTNGNVIAFDNRTLHILWKIKLPYTVLDLVADFSRVYVTYGGTLFAVLDRADGHIIWSIDPFDRLADQTFLSAATIDSDRVYLGSDQHLHAFKRQ